MRNKKLMDLIGALLFFITVSAIVVFAVFVYSKITALTDNKNEIFFVMLLTTLFISIVMTFADLLRRKIMIDKPLEEILSATERIASGDFTARLAPSHHYGSYDEFDLIKENLNKMAEELGKSEVLKNDFISNVSHELKTPLAVIQNYASTLQRSDISEEERKEHTKIILAASKRLTDLVTNILKLNKLENGSIHPEYESVKIHELLAESVITFEEKISEKGIELECDFDEMSLISIPSYLEIVFNNLVSNALKFTERGGKITVTLKSLGDKCKITVADTGCGIPAEDGSRIFEKFYQADSSHSAEGNGLGLALVKKVIDIIGGEISVKSEKGKGSVFTVVLKK